MSTDKENSPRKIVKDEQQEDRNIWRTDITASGDIPTIKSNAYEIAQEAVRLAWAAIWVSVIAVVISVASTIVNLSL